MLKNKFQEKPANQHNFSAMLLDRQFAVGYRHKDATQPDGSDWRRGVAEVQQDGS